MQALAHCCQLLRVRTPGWDSPEGWLELLARPSPQGDWALQQPPIPVMLGRHGLAWGMGQHTCPPEAHPLKQEGDVRAPAGVFALTGLFGDLSPDDPLIQQARLPYGRNTSGLYCVDDPQSCHYNRIVHQADVETQDWRSAEVMLRPDTRYALGVVVDHNPAPAQPGAGSCIFIHVWEGPGQPTAGCTAMAREHLETLFTWLDPAAHPLLVQFPEAEYQSLRRQGLLP